MFVHMLIARYYLLGYTSPGYSCNRCSSSRYLVHCVTFIYYVNNSRVIYISVLVTSIEKLNFISLLQVSAASIIHRVALSGFNNLMEQKLILFRVTSTTQLNTYILRE